MRLKIKVIYDFFFYLFEFVLGPKCGWSKNYLPVSIFQISDAATQEKGEEQQLLEEKKKSLDILQSILKTSIQPQNTRKGKTFKYDLFKCSFLTFFTQYVCKEFMYIVWLSQRCFGLALRPNTRRTSRFGVQDRAGEDRKVLHELISLF